MAEKDSCIRRALPDGLTDFAVMKIGTPESKKPRKVEERSGMDCDHAKAQMNLNPVARPNRMNASAISASYVCFSAFKRAAIIDLTLVARGDGLSEAALNIIPASRRLASSHLLWRFTDFD
jgi:hypothetical protein